MATLALIIAVGGASAFAATHLAKNSVGPKQLKKEAVTTAKLKKGAVTGAKANLSTFGTVPSAANSQTLGGLSADQITQGSKLHCPAGTELAAGVCFETAARPAAKWREAFKACASAGRRLPYEGELAVYLLTKGEEGATNWTGSLSFDADVGGLTASYVEKEKEDVLVSVSAITAEGGY